MFLCAGPSLITHIPLEIPHCSSAACRRRPTTRTSSAAQPSPHEHRESNHLHSNFLSEGNQSVKAEVEEEQNASETIESGYSEEAEGSRGQNFRIEEQEQVQECSEVRAVSAAVWAAQSRRQQAQRSGQTLVF